MDELLKAFTCKTIYIEPIFISSSSLDGIEQYNREHNSSFGESGKKMFRQVGFDDVFHQ